MFRENQAEVAIGRMITRKSGFRDLEERQYSVVIETFLQDVVVQPSKRPCHQVIRGICTLATQPRPDGRRNFIALQLKGQICHPYMKGNQRIRWKCLSGFSLEGRQSCRGWFSEGNSSYRNVLQNLWSYPNSSQFSTENRSST